MPDHDAVAALRDLFTAADSPLAFTGAGVSTECGVPDFRSPDSPWKRNKPIPFAAFVASAEARAEAWRRKFAMDDTYRGARPGRAHRVLTDAIRAGKLAGVVTQNIDNLHQDSGAPEEAIVELHGNGTYATCLDCGLRHELADIRPAFERTGLAPACVACGGAVKSATVSFGQTVPEAQLTRAKRLTLACDLFLAIGSSLVVYPAAALPRLAAENGAALVIVNGEPTPLDPYATLVVRGDVGDVLSAALPAREMAKSG